MKQYVYVVIVFVSFCIVGFLYLLQPEKPKPVTQAESEQLFRVWVDTVSTFLGITREFFSKVPEDSQVDVRKVNCLSKRYSALQHKRLMEQYFVVGDVWNDSISAIFRYYPEQKLYQSVRHDIPDELYTHNEILWKFISSRSDTVWFGRMVCDEAKFSKEFPKYRELSDNQYSLWLIHDFDQLKVELRKLSDKGQIAVGKSNNFQFTEYTKAAGFIISNNKVIFTWLYLGNDQWIDLDRTDIVPTSYFAQEYPDNHLVVQFY